MHTMLIVDDDWLITDSLKNIDDWLEVNIDVVGTAENGDEALFWLEKESIDIILTDIRMPKMDGLTLSKTIQEKKIQTNIIIMSAYQDFSYAQEAMNFNVKRYILKPIDQKELLDTVQNVQSDIMGEDQENVDNKERQYQSEQERIITKSLNYIQSNYMNALSLKELAYNVHLNEHYLGQLFKSVTGKTFSYHLIQVRMEKAAVYLSNPVLKIYEISNMVGYRDSKHFLKIFKRFYECTPKEYRRNLSETTIN